MFLTALVAVAVATPQNRSPFLPQQTSPVILARMLGQPPVPASFTITVFPPAPAASYSVTATLRPSGLWESAIPVGAFAPPGAGRIAVLNLNEGTIPVPSCRVAFLLGNGFACLVDGRLKINAANPYSAGPDPAFFNTIGNPAFTYSSVSVGWAFTVGP